MTRFVPQSEAAPQAGPADPTDADEARNLAPELGTTTDHRWGRKGLAVAPHHHLREPSGVEVEKLGRRLIEIAMPSHLRSAHRLRSHRPGALRLLTETIALPDLKPPADTAEAVSLIAKTAAEGTVSPVEAQGPADILRTGTRAPTLADLEQRMRPWWPRAMSVT